MAREPLQHPHSEGSRPSFPDDETLAAEVRFVMGFMAYRVLPVDLYDSDLNLQRLGQYFKTYARPHSQPVRGVPLTWAAFGSVDELGVARCVRAARPDLYEHMAAAVAAAAILYADHPRVRGKIQWLP